MIVRTGTTLVSARKLVSCVQFKFKAERFVDAVSSLVVYLETVKVLPAPNF